MITFLSSLGSRSTIARRSSSSSARSRSGASATSRAQLRVVAVLGEHLARRPRGRRAGAATRRASSLRRLELAVLAPDRGVALAVRDHLRIRHLALELGEALLDLLDQLLDHAAEATCAPVRSRPRAASVQVACYSLRRAKRSVDRIRPRAARGARDRGPAGAGAAPSCSGRAPTIVDGPASADIHGHRRQRRDLRRRRQRHGRGRRWARLRLRRATATTRWTPAPATTSWTAARATTSFTATTATTGSRAGPARTSSMAAAGAPTSWSRAAATTG